MARSARGLLALTFVTAGLGKLFAGHHFPGFIGPVHLEDALAPYGLALYARFIGYSQVCIGLLLLTRRFAALGAIMLVPMLANILVVTVSLGWRGTPYVNGFLLGVNLYVVWTDRAKWIALMPIASPASGLWSVLAGLGFVLAAPVVSRFSLWTAYAMVVVGVIACIRSGRVPDRRAAG
jgi:hypothetical protein